MTKKRSMLRSTLGVTILILVGKCFGFIREALVAAYYGANAQTDAFFFAQGMPSMIFPAVGNSLALAFTSLFVARITTQGNEKADRYASRMLTASLGLGVVLSMLGALLAPLLVPLFAPGFYGEQLRLAVHLTQLTMGAFVLMMAQYMLAAILNSKQFFIGSQVAGLLYNLCIISVTFALGRGRSMDVLTLTVIGGMAVQVAALSMCCRRQFHYTPWQSPVHPDTAELFHMALPILLGNSIVQINNIVDKALGSTLAEGSLSALSYSGSLNTLVISIFVMSLSTVLYPTLTTDVASGNMERYGKNLLQSLSGLSLLLVPISCITALCAQDIVTIVFARGSFDRTAVGLTAVALACYAPMYIFSGMREVLSRGFFALQDTKTPMINGAIGVGCNIVFSLLFVRYLGIAGIALGTTVSAFVIAVLLLYSAHKRIPALTLRPFLRELCKQLFAGAALVAALVLLHRMVWLPFPLLCFAVDAVFGFAVYFIALFLLRSEETRLIMETMMRKFGEL